MAQERRGSAGFTFMELVLALALAMLLSTWAVATLQEWWQGLRVAALGRHFVGVLETLRYQSLGLQGGGLTICGTPDGQRCDRDNGRRLLAFRDVNRNGGVDAGEGVVLHDDFLEGPDFWLVWRSFQNKDYLRWAAGRTDSMNGTFTLCNRQRREGWLRQVVVNRAGRTRAVLPAREGGAALQAARQACGW